jgi:phosphoserine phosphatase
MSREGDFLIYCMERYRYFKGLSGAEVAEIFERHGIYDYILRYFEALHTMGDPVIVQDIDAQIQMHTGSC